MSELVNQAFKNIVIAVYDSAAKHMIDPDGELDARRLSTFMTQFLSIWSETIESKYMGVWKKSVEEAAEMLGLEFEYYGGEDGNI